MYKIENLINILFFLDNGMLSDIGNNICYCKMGIV